MAHTQNAEDPRLGKIINISYSGVSPEAVVWVWQSKGAMRFGKWLEKIKKKKELDIWGWRKANR